MLMLSHTCSPGVIVVILTYPHIILSISIFYFNASIWIRKGQTSSDKFGLKCPKISYEGDKNVGMTQIGESMSGSVFGHNTTNLHCLGYNIYKIYCVENIYTVPFFSVVLFSYNAFAFFSCSSVFTRTLAWEQLQDSIAGGFTIISVVVTREADVFEKPIKHIVIQRLILLVWQLKYHIQQLWIPWQNIMSNIIKQSVCGIK